VIKLQMLLVPGADSAAVEHACKWLESQGVRITGTGSRSLSAQTDADTFCKLFGEPPKTVSGFARGLHDARPLDVPEPVRKVVQLLTTIPRHDKL
jgi:hypothetical protein